MNEIYKDDDESELIHDKNERLIYSTSENAPKLNEDQEDQKQIDLINSFINGNIEAIIEIHTYIMNQQQQIDIMWISETILHPAIMQFITQCDDDNYLLPAVRVLALTSNRKSPHIVEAFDQSFIEKMLMLMGQNIEYVNHGLCFLINILNSDFSVYPTFRDALFFDFCNSKLMVETNRAIFFLISRMIKRTLPKIVENITDEDSGVIDLFINNFIPYIIQSKYEESVLKIQAGISKVCSKSNEIALRIIDSEICGIIFSFLHESESESENIFNGALLVINSFVMSHEETILDKLIVDYDLFNNFLPLLQSPEPRIVAFSIEVFRQILICSPKYVDIILSSEEIIGTFITLAKEGDFESRKIATYFICELFTSQRNTDLWTYLIENEAIEILVDFLQSGDDDLSKFVITTIWHIITYYPNAAHYLAANDIFNVLEDLEDNKNLKSSAIPELIHQIHTLLKMK